MSRLLCQLALALTLTTSLHAAKPPEPALRIPLLPLGFQSVQPQYLTAGGTMFTVDFIDPNHLIATWNTHSLLTRLADSEPGDQDRTVEAVLLELPTGKVLARTTWRMRDHARYLWPLGRGHFLLRIRNEFFTISPLEDLPTGHPFERHLILFTKRPVGFVFLSPGAEVLTVETLSPQTKPMEAASTFARSASGPGLKTRPAPSATPALQTRSDPAIQVNFYRVVHHEPHEPANEPGTGGPTEANGGIFLQAAGAVRASVATYLPVTGEGFLDVVKESTNSYLFDFVPLSGKRLELPAFDTSCYPHVHFVDRADFVAFGCRGSEDKQELGFFNLHGDHPWLSTFPNRHINPAIVSVPSAGRFALVRTVVNSAAVDLANIVDAEIVDQELTVFQAHDGRQLLKLLPTPVQRAGGNFDLSPDGLSVAVIRAGNIEIYRLPPLSKRDQQEIAAAESLAGPAGTGPLRIGKETARDDTPPTAQTALPAVSAPSAAPPPQADRSAAATSGDPDPSAAPRKPPSLYDPQHPKAPN